MESVELKRLYGREKTRNEKLKLDIEKLTRELQISSKQLALYDKHIKQIEKVEEEAKRKLKKLEESFAKEQSLLGQADVSDLSSKETGQHAGDN